MESIELTANFYQIFDRIGEGVLYKYNVEYYWEDILKNNVTKNNFKFIPIGFCAEGLAYLKKYHINHVKWEELMLEHLHKDNFSYVIETFFEEIPENMFQVYHNAIFSKNTNSNTEKAVKEKSGFFNFKTKTI